MSSEDEYARLVSYFRQLGYHVSRREVGGADTVVVASKPEVASGITVYQRSVQLHRGRDEQWYTSLGMVTLPWNQPLEDLHAFVREIMESDDGAYSEEKQRRGRGVSGVA